MENGESLGGISQRPEDAAEEEDNDQYCEHYGDREAVIYDHAGGEDGEEDGEYQRRREGQAARHAGVGELRGISGSGGGRALGA